MTIDIILYIMSVVKKESDVSTSTREFKVNLGQEPRKKKYNFKVFKWIHEYSLFIIRKLVFKIANFNKNNNKKDEMIINENIRVPELMVIGPNGEQMGTKNLADALTIANFAGLDLVLMNPGAERPVAKIMDYNKYKYERNKKQKDAMKKQRENNKDTKEYQLSVKIDVGDFETRRRNAQNYLEKGHKIKVTIRFKGREMAHTELGRDVMLKFYDALKDYCEISSEPNLEGRTMTMMLSPIKKEKEN